VIKMPFTTPIDLSPISEGELSTLWIVEQPLNFHSVNTEKNYVVPAGTLTDLASGFARAASAAAILHDHLYQRGIHFKQIKDQQEADDVFYEAMIDTGVPQWRAWAYYWAVRMFGWRYYKNPLITAKTAVAPK